MREPRNQNIEKCTENSSGIDCALESSTATVMTALAWRRATIRPSSLVRTFSIPLLRNLIFRAVDRIVTAYKLGLYAGRDRSCHGGLHGGLAVAVAKELAAARCGDGDCGRKISRTAFENSQDKMMEG